LQIIFIVCSKGQPCNRSEHKCTAAVTYIPVISIISLPFQSYIGVDVLLQVRKLFLTQILKDTIWIDNVKVRVGHFVVEEVPLRIDETEDDGQPVDGPRTTVFDSYLSLLLGLLQHKDVLLGHPFLLLTIGSSLGWYD
jgi:hypothetical protein